jgi:copper chaperone CopZ
VRVALKNISGVQKVDVSLEKGEAVAVLAPGNTVRYEQLLEAIAKNGFIVKGAKVTAIGRVTVLNHTPQLNISGSGDHFRLEPASRQIASVAQMSDKNVNVIGTVPEAAKGKLPEVLRYESVEAK